MNLKSFKLLEKMSEEGTPMKPVVSEITKTRKTLETLSATINKSLDDVNMVMDSLDHVLAEHIQARKMESIGLMAGGIAHDFKNFIHIIAVNINAIKTLSQDIKVMKRCEQILEVCYRASDLVDKIFTLAKTEYVQTQQVNLNEEVKKSVLLLDGTLSKNIKLEIILYRDLPQILGDATHIRQVIINLVSNAKDAINDKGHIKVATERVTLGDADCQGHGNARPGEFASLVISDSGVGIPQDLIPRVFDPFFSTKKGDNNAGFGLAMVYAIVENHQGWIDVVSKEGKGTIFTLYFPVSIIEGNLRQLVTD